MLLMLEATTLLHFQSHIGIMLCTLRMQVWCAGV